MLVLEEDMLSQEDVKVATTSRVLVKLEHVSFSYASATSDALSDICLEIHEGDFVGVIGPSGAGKTTLASVLSGAVPHHSSGKFRGACIVGGLDTCEVGLTDVSRMVGSVLQDIDAQMVAANVEDEMLYGLENFGVDHKQIMDRVKDALEIVGITDLLHREIATLSGGQKQKVAIAAILALRPHVMVLDEPTAALDPASSQMVFDTLRRLNETEHMTIVIVEQKVALLAQYCQRIVVLDSGRVAISGTPQEVFSHSEELRRIGVDSPRVTRVSNKLRDDGLLSGAAFLTADEAASGISCLIADFKKSERDVTWEPKRSAEVSAARAQLALMTSSDPQVVFDHVGFSYGPGAASVDDLCLEVSPGELVGIIGQNGAGKTTLTKLMNGLLKPQSGSVVICGLDTHHAKTSQIAHYVSTLFQNPDHQICKNTVIEEVAFSLELLGVSGDEALSRAGDAISYFSLPADASPFTLSRGQRQIVALASIVVTNPKVLILDEPTSGLDYRECMVVMRAVCAAREQGCAVIMVCHDMEVASDFATRLVVMGQGRILADGDASKLFEQDDLMQEASVAPPQIMRVSSQLSHTSSACFKGISEVGDLVGLTEELVGR
jgi:energy-coupling factor transport system ATP-binding protein